MTWLPEFKLGLWNTWILMLVIVLHPFILLAVDRAAGTGGILKKMGDAPADPREKRLGNLTTLVLYLFIFATLFLPLKTGTVPFYAGLALWLAGLAIFLMAAFTAAVTPIGCIFERGIYRFSRHPFYLSMLVMLLGALLASAAWILLPLPATFIALMDVQAASEERACLAAFGESYRDYMRRTPRWLGLPRR